VCPLLARCWYTVDPVTGAPKPLRPALRAVNVLTCRITSTTGRERDANFALLLTWIDSWRVKSMQRLMDTLQISRSEAALEWPSLVWESVTRYRYGSTRVPPYIAYVSPRMGLFARLVKSRKVREARNSHEVLEFGSSEDVDTSGRRMTYLESIVDSETPDAETALIEREGTIEDALEILSFIELRLFLADIFARDDREGREEVERAGAQLGLTAAQARACLASARAELSVDLHASAPGEKPSSAHGLDEAE
jgi:hypothetical protein